MISMELFTELSDQQQEGCSGSVTPALFSYPSPSGNYGFVAEPAFIRGRVRFAIENIATGETKEFVVSRGVLKKFAKDGGTPEMAFWMGSRNRSRGVPA